MYNATAKSDITQRTLALLISSALACLTQAAADEADIVLARELAKQLHYRKEPTSATAKVWPGSKDKTIAAYVTLHKDERAKTNSITDDETYDLDMFVVKSGSGEILQRYSEKNAFTSDAMHFDGISLDTANYALQPGVRAFGIRATSHHMGCAGADSESISLFVPDGRGLKQVLTNLMMKSNTSMCGSCENELTQRTIAIADSSHFGMHDLILSERKSGQEPDMKEGACDGKTFNMKMKYLLRFDGVAYSLPEGLN